jgi:NAD(P)-dependent dehydrogenase (short-subunit alcohol dehydrogenase family)
MVDALGFTGARVLVLGASSGIGRAAATRFAQAGARVAMASRGGDKLQRAADEVGAEALELDVRDNAKLEAFFGEREAFDHVVISAAQTKAGSVASLALDEARAAMDSKFWGAYQVARAAKVRPGGSLTFVSGVLARRPNPASVLQGAINGAIEALARGLALERAPVRVNTVSPGIIETPLWDGLPAQMRQAMFDRTSERLPTGRIGSADDVASAILFVAANTFVTGATIAVDGGGAIA